MTVTDSTGKTNTSEQVSSRSGWQTFNEPESCWRSITRHNRGRYSLQRICCHRLDCHECGPRKRQATYEKAIVRHALEEEIWVVYVHATHVDRMRKIAGRAGEPIESIPVADDWNAVLSPFHFQGASQLSADEMQDLYMKRRIGRRQHTRSGRWAPEPAAKEPQGETLSREFVSPEAFKAVASELGARVYHSREDLYFDDPSGIAPEVVRKMFIGAEHRIRNERRRKRGWLLWGGHWIRTQAKT